jgi:hypothetical protein
VASSMTAATTRLGTTHYESRSSRTAFVCWGTLSPDEAVMARVQAVSCEARRGHQYNDAIPDERIGRAFL